MDLQLQHTRQMAEIPNSAHLNLLKGNVKQLAGLISTIWMKITSTVVSSNVIMPWTIYISAKNITIVVKSFETEASLISLTEGIWLSYGLRRLSDNYGGVP